MDFATALQIVIDLASQNVIDEVDNKEEYDRQMEAISQVEDYAVNHEGDD